jgi:hypothetical protein
VTYGHIVTHKTDETASELTTFDTSQDTRTITENKTCQSLYQKTQSQILEQRFSYRNKWLNTSYDF